MAIAFANTKGKAVSNKVDSFEFNKDGEYVCRLVGGILPRYMYWLKGTNNKPIPMECLSFDREKEKFTNIETDHVPTFFPELKCSWSYSVNCIDPKDGKVKVFNLKKKLFEQILGAAENLGDPTDVDEGWDIVFKRAKNGPNTFNVEYTLNAFKLKKRALTEAERAAVAVAKPIDELILRQTPEEQLASLTKITSGTSDEGDGGEGSEEAKDL
jgi:hypothetical protein